MCNDLSQKKLEKMFHRSEITAQSFEKTVLEKRPQYERTSKIHSRG